MRLRRVVLSGFKTFARRSEVVLDPGITAVVGPNGSGKSNLVDAIRWALGETNARELRGARMDEVIFGGGQGRGPMGVAHVELTLDNEEGRLPTDDAEVSIARRVTRNGDSEFRVNGSRVRLRDVERLLGATGLTQNGYSVVAQHDIDGIIQATPQQRRTLVEEAAGVRGLRAAREDALRRVTETETRLLRMDDLLADAEPRLAALAEQAAVALEQRAMAERLAELRGSLAREAWRAARAQARRARQRLQSALQRAEAAAEAEAGFTARLDRERAVLDGAKQEQRDAAQRLEAARVEAERAAGELRRWTDRETSGALQRAASGAEAEAAAGDMATWERRIDDLTRAAAAAEAGLQALEQRLAELRREHDGALGAARETEADLRVRDDHARRAEREHEAAAAAARDHAARAAMLEEAAARLAGEAGTARDRAAALEAEARGTAERAEHLEAARLAAEEAAVAARGVAGDLRRQAAEAQAVEAEAQRAASESTARAAALHGQVEGALGGGAIAAAVDAGRLAAVRLVERFRVRDARDQAAVEAALENHLAAWLVDDPAAAGDLLGEDGIREEVLRAGMPLPSVPEAPAGSRRAAAAVEADGDALGALAHALSGAWLVEDMEAALAALATAGGRAVLPDGTVVTAAGIRGGGRPGTTIALAAAEREAVEAARAAVAARDAAAAASVAAVSARGSAESEAERLAAAAQAARIAAAEASAAAATTAAASRAEGQRAAALDEERAERAAAAEAANQRRLQAEAEAERLAAVHAEAAAAAATAAAAHEERRGALDTLGEAVRTREIELARSRPEAAEVQRRLTAARQTLEQASQRHRLAELRLLGAEGEVLAAIARRRGSTVAAAAAERAVEDAIVSLERAAQPVVLAEAAVAALETERSEVAVAAARAADERVAAEMELAGAEERVAELAEAVRGDDDEEGPELDTAAAERVEREITRLERRIAGLGPVNALAPEQHASLDEQVTRVRTDRSDLAAACRDLRALASILAEEIARRFDAVFGAVAYHFHGVFEELFPGGRATLRLEEVPPVDETEGEEAETDPRRRREPGIEILAQPAGKRLQALSLLSGGERALTALAMILALQQVNPSPFYVFDEVDAPLDDANIGRFTRVMRRLSAGQQFIVVTHNHATMAAADALYGVTMEGDGTSRLLSVRFVQGQAVPYEPRVAAAVG